MQATATTTARLEPVSPQKAAQDVCAVVGYLLKSSSRDLFRAIAEHEAQVRYHDAVTRAGQPKA